MDQLLAVGFVLCISLAAAWAIRRKQGWQFRWPPARKSDPRRLCALERLPLTGQHTLHLVQIGNRIVLVGTHPTGLAFEETAGTSFRDVLTLASRDQECQGGAE
ncbi:MAG: flagellar biosynthetic protein FliO [Acidobacteria bacterium]|nr:flagellar biosynthetic protein FliO [Acidobacteriota bacterium]